MADTRPKWDATRIFILVIVAVFALSSLTLSIWVIWEQTRGDDETSSVIDTSELLNQNQATTVPTDGEKLEGFTPITEALSQIQTTDLTEGTGAAVTGDEKMTLHYTGAFATTGVIFESSLTGGTPIATQDMTGAASSLNEAALIQGWIQGIPGMKVGGKRRILIPAELGYGAMGSGTIPANTDLVFDVELLTAE